MNERIRELAEQAKLEFVYDPTETPTRVFVECWDDELEKFAELIVRECADLVDDHNDSYPYVSFGDMIKQHFGVEP